MLAECHETLNLTDLAVLLRTTEVTLRRKIRENTGPETVDPFPILRRGRAGMGYAFDPRDAVAWWSRAADRERRATEMRRARVDQLRFELLGGETGGDEPAGLSAAARERECRAELAAIALGKQRGELIKAADVEAVVADALAGLRKEIAALPETLVRDLGIDRTLVSSLRAIVDATLTRCADQLAAMDPGGD